MRFFQTLRLNSCILLILSLSKKTRIIYQINSKRKKKKKKSINNKNLKFSQ